MRYMICEKSEPCTNLVCVHIKFHNQDHKCVTPCQIGKDLFNGSVCREATEHELVLYRLTGGVL